MAPFIQQMQLKVQLLMQLDKIKYMLKCNTNKNRTDLKKNKTCLKEKEIKK